MTADDTVESPERLPDQTLIARLVSGGQSGEAPPSFVAELARRAGDQGRAVVLRRLLEGYAYAAPEYVDEETQAAARVCLAQLEASTHR